ncbi:MAG: formate--tetrahydrofolate ligase, partial [Eubacteriales bacterium]
RLPCVVAVNRFPTDTDAEIELVINKCAELGVKAVLSTVWADGGNGAIELANEVVKLCEKPSDFKFCYELEGSIEDKINTIVRRIYRGDGAMLTPAAKKEADRLTAAGYGNLPICMAKTQYSFSDDMTKPGAPEGFTVTVRGLRLSAGAGFIVALTGDIMTMPGLPKSPAAERIDVDESGKISGLF